MTEKQQTSDVPLTRYIIRETMGVAMLAVLLLWPAGDWAWPWGWAVVAVTFGWATGTLLVLLRRNPGLIADRMGARGGGQGWDKALLSVIGLLTMARAIIAGFDYRYGWSAGFPALLQWLGVLLAAGGYGMVVWATSANAYFSQVVEIQEARDHSVQTGGPYRFVRHPGYCGTLLFELGSSFALGSWWAVLIGVANVAMFFLRTAKEDTYLHENLIGYPEYAEQTKYRLIPGVW